MAKFAVALFGSGSLIARPDPQGYEDLPRRCNLEYPGVADQVGLMTEDGQDRPESVTCEGQTCAYQGESGGWWKYDIPEPFNLPGEPYAEVGGAPAEETWSFHLSVGEGIEAGGFTGPVEVDIDGNPKNEAYELVWDVTGDGEAKISFGGEVVEQGTGGTIEVDETSGSVSLRTVEKLPAPTHFQARWEFPPDRVVKVNGVPQNYVLGTIVPFQVGSVSWTGGSSLESAPQENIADIRHDSELFASVLRVRYFRIVGNDSELVGFKGDYTWQNPTNPAFAPPYTGRPTGPLEYATAHIVSASGGAWHDRLSLQDPGNPPGEPASYGMVYACEITEINPDMPDDTAPPPDEGGWSGGGGGGTSWPEEPDPEEHPEEHPGGPGPTEPPETGTRPEATIECVCAVFLLYIGDWVQNVSINIWNLCQYVFQITQAIGTWIGYLAGVLKSGLDWIGDSLDSMLTYFEYFLEEWRRGNDAAERSADALEGIKGVLEEIRDKPPIDVVVADDEVMVHGVEQEEDLPEVWLRRGIK